MWWMETNATEIANGKRWLESGEVTRKTIPDTIFFLLVIGPLRPATK
jgi:hypothetical protein